MVTSRLGTPTCIKDLYTFHRTHGCLIITVLSPLVVGGTLRLSEWYYWHIFNFSAPPVADSDIFTVYPRRNAHKGIVGMQSWDILWNSRRTHSNEIWTSIDNASCLSHYFHLTQGQFTQIASPKGNVVTASSRDLEYHAELLDLFGLTGPIGLWRSYDIWGIYPPTSLT
jgi:hypothetical protein